MSKSDSAQDIQQMDHDKLTQRMLEHQNEPNEFIKYLHEILKRDADKDKLRMSEREFFNEYLPLFAKLEDIDPEVGFKKWITRVGSPAVEVLVVNDQGEVLYTVPPMGSTRLTLPLSRDGNKELFQLLNVAAIRQAINPPKAQQLMDIVNARFEFYTPESLAKIRDYQRQWLKIFAFYNLTYDDGTPVKETDLDGPVGDANKAMDDELFNWD